MSSGSASSSLDEIEEHLKIFLEAGLAPNTRKAYVTGQNAWASFIALNQDCEPWLYGLDRDDELRAERQVMRFALFLAPFSQVGNYSQLHLGCS